MTQTGNYIMRDGKPIPLQEAYPDDRERAVYLEGAMQTVGEQVVALRAKLAESNHLPNLGLASNEEMFRELICRFKHDGYTHPGAFERALVLAEMLGGLSAPEREYRTVDHD